MPSRSEARTRQWVRAQRWTHARVRALRLFERVAPFSRDSKTDEICSILSPHDTLVDYRHRKNLSSTEIIAVERLLLGAREIDLADSSNGAVGATKRPRNALAIVRPLVVGLFCSRCVRVMDRLFFRSVGMLSQGGEYPISLVPGSCLSLFSSRLRWVRHSVSDSSYPRSLALSTAETRENKPNSDSAAQSRTRALRFTGTLLVETNLGRPDQTMYYQCVHIYVDVRETCLALLC